MVTDAEGSRTHSVDAVKAQERKIGRIFWAGPVYELVDGEPDLRVLEDRDLIRRRATSSMAGEREYAIKHALTREVAYASLTKANRAQMHARFATWLESVGEGNDEFAAVLAHHYAEAVRPEDADLAWVGKEEELGRLRGRALQWLERAAGVAVKRYGIEDALAFLNLALGLQPEADAQARIWRAIGMANALKFDGDAFLIAMQQSLTVSTSKVMDTDTYSELAFQTAIRAGMWRRRPDEGLVRSWIDRALDLAEPGSLPQVRALLARCFWDTSNAETAREAWDLAERLGNLEMRSHAMAAQSDTAFFSGDFQTALTWSLRRFDALAQITDPDHIADIYGAAIPCCCATTRFAEARSLAAKHQAVVQSLSAHHRLHGFSVVLEVEEICGSWQRIIELSERTLTAVEANLATPCVRNPPSLLVMALAAAYTGDHETARRYEQRADAIATEGYDFALAAPRARLALLRGEVDALGKVIEELDLARAGPWFVLQSTAASLDALVATGRRSQLESEAPPLLRTQTYLEPFALRALGVIREDAALVEQAAGLFAAMGLDWHAEQTRIMTA